MVGNYLLVDPLIHLYIMISGTLPIRKKKRYEPIKRIYPSYNQRAIGRRY
jgi:hypothetical protein